MKSDLVMIVRKSEEIDEDVQALIEESKSQNIQIIYKDDIDFDAFMVVLERWENDVEESTKGE